MPLLTRCCFKLPALWVTLFTAGCLTSQAPAPTTSPSFNQDKAYARLVELCDLGPRNHGSQGKRKAEDLIKRVLQEAGAEVSIHEFQHTASGTSEPASFRNIIGRIKPQEKRRVLLGTHYDTRTWADKDPREELRNTPIIGANDGASGVAVLLELAIAWKDHPPRIGIDLIFFDGEDFGWGQNWDDYFLGSKAWVRDHPNYHPEWGVIVDMIGDTSLRISKERQSLAEAPETVQRIWDAASRAGAGSFVDEMGGRVLDDHTAFLDKGLPVVLLIDFQYRWFHTTGDTPDKCSADSLGQVGRTLMEATEASWVMGRVNPGGRHDPRNPLNGTLITLINLRSLALCLGCPAKCFHDPKKQAIQDLAQEFRSLGNGPADFSGTNELTLPDEHGRN